MNQYHLDKKIERRNTASVKWDAQQRQFYSNELIPFWIADMDFAVAPCITRELEQRVEHPVYGYSLPPAGYREAVCSWFEKRHGIKVQPEWILPAGHAVTMLAIALRAVTKPGDVCLILTPAYEPFFQIIKGAGRDILVLQMTEKDCHYEIDFLSMERCFSAGVRCLFFCNPHNPGGKVWKKQELQKIGRLCQKYDVTILSDDVHCDWALESWGYTSFLSIPEAADRTIIVTSPSKTFNLAGFSISNLMIAGKDLRGQVQKELMSMFVKGSNFLGYIAAKAAYAGAEEWVDEVRSYVYKNGEYLKKQLKDKAPKLRLYDHEGTFMLWLDCRQIEADSGRICEELAGSYGISVNNGADYGKGGKGFIRINIGCPRSMVEACADALTRWYRDRTLRTGGDERVD